jgi:L-lysine exporter family protein LysE/ArgO
MYIYLSLVKGFITSASLIVAIGAQNAFVIKQGLTKNNLLVTALLCSLLDAFLIALGLFGLGKIISVVPNFIFGAKIFAVAYLFLYGLLSFRSAFSSGAANKNSKQSTTDLKKTILTIIALTLLNPHAYLDAVILLGSIANAEPEGMSLYFGIGAITASFAWFFSLTYGCTKLSPLMNKPGAHKIIDCSIGAIMWTIAISLILNEAGLI